MLFGRHILTMSVFLRLGLRRCARFPFIIGNFYYQK